MVDYATVQVTGAVAQEEVTTCSKVSEKRPVSLEHREQEGGCQRKLRQNQAGSLGCFKGLFERVIFKNYKMLNK